MKPPTLVYCRPHSLDEALELLAEHGDEARPLAGGQSLVPMLNHRLARPEVLVDIGAVGELQRMERRPSDWLIGATVTQRRVETDGTEGYELDRADLPYTTPSGALLDSGSFTESFERVVELGEQALERAEARCRAEEDSLVGVGYAVFFEGVSPTHHGASAHWTGHESCSIEIQPDGGVRVASGVTDQGQGTTTFVATLTADALGVPLETVHVEVGDSDAAPYGLGAFGSRQAVIGGGAILMAATEVRDKVKQIAAHMLEASTEDLVLEEGCVRVAGSPEPSVTMAQIATAATIRTLELPPGMAPGLEATARYEPELIEHVPDEKGRINPCASYANAAHAAVIRVDRGTGEIEILDYILAHDCGTVINPRSSTARSGAGSPKASAGPSTRTCPTATPASPRPRSWTTWCRR